MFPFTDLTHAYLNNIVLGAGAIYGLASFFAFAAPKARFLLFFVVPMPAWACIGAITCFDVYNAVTRQVRRSFSFSPRHLPEMPPPSHALSLRLILYTVLFFGLGGTRWWAGDRRTLLDDANKV
jgi:membrane associated rhomboid family serine protease